MLHKAIEQFLGDVHWGDLDVLLIDLPPGTGDVTLTLLELLPDAQLLAVTTPQPAAQTVAARVGRMARDARMPVAGVIENMSTLVCSSCDAETPLFGEGGGARLAADIGTTLLGQVPLDLPLRTAGDLGVPAMVATPDAPSVVELRRIAADLPVGPPQPGRTVAPAVRRVTTVLTRITPPARGDLVAAATVALVLVPQALAYASIAGLDPVYGLYAAVAAPIAGALVGSSPYLQTGPVAVTSLLTFGALEPLAEPQSLRFAALAAVLALVVGLVRVTLGLVGAGPIAYLMSQPVVVSFTTAAALLIVCTQVPSLLGVDVDAANPLVGAFAALADPTEWAWVDVALGLGALVVMLGGRRLWAFFPGALVAVAAATAWSTLVGYDGATVGTVDLQLHAPRGIALGDLGALLLPGLVIAVIGFAEPASIARRYAAEDRQPWNSNREFVGQGLANLASGAAGGFPVGGSFSRTGLNRLSGARTRWSGAFTGLIVLAILPFAGVLANLPLAVLAGLVIGAVAVARGRPQAAALLALVEAAVRRRCGDGGEHAGVRAPRRARGDPRRGRRARRPPVAGDARAGALLRRGRRAAPAALGGAVLRLRPGRGARHQRGARAAPRRDERGAAPRLRRPAGPHRSADAARPGGGGGRRWSGRSRSAGPARTPHDCSVGCWASPSPWSPGAGPEPGQLPPGSSRNGSRTTRSLVAGLSFLTLL